MNRILLIAFIFVLGLAVGLAVLAYFAYVIETGPPPAAEVAGLNSPATVKWSASQVATVEAQTAEDAWTALGYAQASRQTWPMLLYRAAALGRLSSMIGHPGVDSDRLALRLGIADGARAAFERLNTSEQGMLEAFARGINGALSDRRILRDPALILSGVQPQLWEAWHSIAVERLFAWLGSETDVDTTASINRPLRAVLLMHDFDKSSVIASVHPIEAGLYARYVYGSTALPALFEVTMTSGEGGALQGACLVGTPFFVAGRTRGRVWAFLPTSSYELSPLTEARRLRTSYERLHPKGGSENVVAIARDSLGVVLSWDERQRTAPDSSDRILSWTGHGAVSDAATWLSIHSEEAARFSLFDGAGITLGGDNTTLVGPGMTTTRSKFFVTVSESPWARYSIARLDSLASDATGFYPRIWFNDTYSTWASEVVPMLVEAASDSAAGPMVQDAISYLRNWDFAFDRASIAASILNVWAEIALELEGSWPLLGSTEANEDGTPDRRRWSAFLEFAVARLATDFDGDMSM
ncbi:MAG: penicillin acylase family protein, partial [Rhodothermales bacterium]|nr:penicillin acylase family protein [Rhodothermales bacterium]